MARETHSTLVLVSCLLVSIGLHAGAAAWLSTQDRAIPEQRVITPATPTDEARTTLGIERSEAVTISWIGFQDPTPHRAVQASVDQAQVSPQAGAMRELMQAAPAAAAQASEAVQEVVQALRSRLEASTERMELAAKRAEQQRAADEAAERARQASEAQRAQQQAEAGSPGDAAVPDDREAQATSTNPPLSYTLGQPVAREGLRIRTVIPRFDATTRLTDLRALTRKPVVAVTFGRDGAVLDARILPGTASGRRSVDEPILNAVFQWRATGEDLDSIPVSTPPKGLTVEIRFDF